MMAPYRERVVPKAEGRVLEIGIGAGANLPFYDPQKVSEIVGMEPSFRLQDMARRAAEKQDIPVSIVSAAAEAVPFADDSFDTVVSTFTLCSVEDNITALFEARRVLRPGGHFLFCEHGLAADEPTRQRQRKWDPLWARVLGGCHNNRPVAGSIEQVFPSVSSQGGFQGNRASLGGWMEWGEARLT